MSVGDYVIDLRNLRMTDVELVGGKNASLGEMVSQLSGVGVRVPGGFATTSTAYRDFLAQDDLDKKIAHLLSTTNVDDIDELVRTGSQIREWIINTSLPVKLETEIRNAYQELVKDDPSASVAVRSSATAEDLPDASFAGQQETFLNIVGIENVLLAVRHVFASLYNDRAISYRVHKGFTHSTVALSAGIQRMVRSDLGAAGVMFTLDTESGFRDVVFITSSYGLGETVVQGAVNPDEFYVHKPMLKANKQAIVRRRLGSKMIKMIFTQEATAGRSVQTINVDSLLQGQFSITDAEVIELSHYAMSIEAHYGRPMDIEWGKDGKDGKLYILQARPETVKSQLAGDVIERFSLKTSSKILVSGRAIGQKIGVGKIRLIKDASEMNRVQVGDILVTDMTDPNWEPVMKRAAAIVTNRGGRTCHAAIIARELGIPAIVGCGDATEQLYEAQMATVSCAEGDTGNVYDGVLDFELTSQATGAMPPVHVKIMMNVGNPDLAFNFAQMPHQGVGLARVEFIINNAIGIHPKAILAYPSVPDHIRVAIEERARGYANPRQFFVQSLAQGIATIAAAFWPHKVIVRLSDFKSNEYRKLIAGEYYEPEEENPMLGFRGASRYLSQNFGECFQMECEAMRTVREAMGFQNVELMIPFVRTLEEGKKTVELLKQHGLTRGENGLRIIMMCELPTNALLAEQFLEYFDGFSIGSNDLTQLTLGLDRDSGLVADLFDERDASVKILLSMAIKACRRHKKYIGICGQGPSDHPDFADWLVSEGIESLSLNPDTVHDTWIRIAEKEAQKLEEKTHA